ncbi:DUF1127 domain-containing protein [Rhodoligotrophos ferricapiens]|uniref:DUF1127 domain-containing protein n=1 Tax=Rhodoligotrophos ferricapiens TaxID=3069264 RepID=UPI00315C9927
MSALALKLLSRKADRALLEKIDTAYHALGTHRERKLAATALAKLDDRLLNDIGVSRAEIQLDGLGLADQKKPGWGQR